MGFLKFRTLNIIFHSFIILRLWASILAIEFISSFKPFFIQSSFFSSHVVNGCFSLVTDHRSTLYRLITFPGSCSLSVILLMMPPRPVRTAAAARTFLLDPRPKPSLPFRSLRSLPCRSLVSSRSPPCTVNRRHITTAQTTNVECWYHCVRKLPGRLARNWNNCVPDLIIVVGCAISPSWNPGSELVPAVRTEIVEFYSVRDLGTSRTSALLLTAPPDPHSGLGLNLQIHI